MPELPDIDVYVEKLEERILDQPLEAVRIGKPFLLRSVEPPLRQVIGQPVTGIRRLGKRIAIGLAPDYWLVLHLMIAGRLHWHERTISLKARISLAAFDFPSGTLLLTEAGTRKRASLYLVRGAAALREHDPGGAEPLLCTLEEFTNRLQGGNHTLKRALTNPRTLSGIGNAYSDEILHAARLSPLKLTGRLTSAEISQLYAATRNVLTSARDRLRRATGKEFPKKVTAFHKQMAVHGRFGLPCPDCGSPIARIRYKSNETNYCPGCQNNGRLLADRSLSRLLKDDWPESL